MKLVYSVIVDLLRPGYGSYVSGDDDLLECYAKGLRYASHAFKVDASRKEIRVLISSATDCTRCRNTGRIKSTQRGRTKICPECKGRYVTEDLYEDLVTPEDVVKFPCDGVCCTPREVASL